MDSYVYHYCAFAEQEGGRKYFDGIYESQKPIEKEAEYSVLKRSIAYSKDHQEPLLTGDIIISSLTLLRTPR